MMETGLFKVHPEVFDELDFSKLLYPNPGSAKSFLNDVNLKMRISLKPSICSGWRANLAGNPTAQKASFSKELGVGPDFGLIPIMNATVISKFISCKVTGIPGISPGSGDNAKPKLQKDDQRNNCY